MLPRRDAPYPLEACRDLIAVVRAWRLSLAEDDRVLLQRLLEVEQDLEEVHGMAALVGPETVGHRAAWERTARACAVLADLEDGMLGAQPLVRAAQERALAVLRKK